MNRQFKVIVTGDRWWCDERTMRFELQALPPATYLVHGACTGADWFSGVVGRELGFTIEENPADWDKYKRAAGPIRNDEMRKKHPDADLILGFHNDIANSRGTKHMLDGAKKDGFNWRLVTSHWPLINSFRDEFCFLSNMYGHEITWRGLRWKTSEHAYQACKTTNVDDIRAIRDCPTPFQAKKFSRGVRLRDDWEDVKIAHMTEILRAKFSDPTLSQMLVATGDATLVEDNTWRDTFWGVHKGVGTNHLGKLLMSIRDELNTSL